MTEVSSIQRIDDTRLLSQVIIRQVTRNDLPALEWEGEFRHFRKMYQEAYNRFQKGLSVLWVADLPAVGIIGQVFIQFVCDRPELADGVNRAYLYSFRVRPIYRSMGLGTYMMQVLETDLKRRGFRYVTLNVARTNRRAQELYERQGYRVVAPEPGIWSYQDENDIWHTVEEPAWRMEKPL